MAKYIVTDTNLSSIADAIRTKGNTSESLAFPSGFITAIDNLSTGGGEIGYIEDVFLEGREGFTQYYDSGISEIGSYAFYNYISLTTAQFPQVTTIGSSAFYGCSSLTTASFPKATTISTEAFESCVRLKSLYLLGSSVVLATGHDIFNSTPIGGYTTGNNGVYGSVFVPASLLSAYKSATNWISISSRIVGLT